MSEYVIPRDAQAYEQFILTHEEKKQLRRAQSAFASTVARLAALQASKVGPAPGAYNVKAGVLAS